MDFASIEGSVRSIAGTLFTTALTMAQPILTMGNKLLLWLALLVIVWKGIEFMLDDEKGSVIFEFFKMMMFIALVKWLLDAYFMLVPELYAGFTTIQGALTGGQTPVTATFGRVWSAFEKVSYLGETLSKQGNWTDVIMNAGIQLKLALVQMIGLIGVGIVVGVYLAMLLMVQIFIAVGIIVAPILIPFFLIPYFSWMADGVVRYMIVTGMIGLVLAIVLTLASTIASNAMGYNHSTKNVDLGTTGIGALNRMSESQIKSLSYDQALAIAADVSLSDALALFMLMAIIGWGIMQAPSIAEMLLAGRGVGGSTVSGARSMGAGAGATGAAAARSSASGIRGAGAVAGKIKAWRGK